VDSNAGSEISSFNLELRDTLTHVWQTMSSSLSTQLAFNTVKGESYELRYRVSNRFGFSDYSPIASFQAGDVPSEPLPPRLLQVNSAGITVELDMLSIDDGGLPLSSYSMEI
jgi:hypothetical protein